MKGAEGMLIKFIATGMICKNPACNYKDDAFTMKDYKAWYNKPCPHCGRPLLSTEEYHALKYILGEQKTSD